AGLADDRHARLGLDDGAQARADQRLVVGDQDGDGHGASGPGRGIDASTSKPPPGRAPVRRVPPYAAARSRIPTIPWAVLRVRPLGPAPSSCTETRTAPPLRMTVTPAFAPAPACLRTLVSASCTIR